MGEEQGQQHVSIPRLDVIRAICFLMVFGLHAFYTDDPTIKAHWAWRWIISPLFSNGAVGVNVFFALSGFLITFLLIREKRLRQRIDVPRFWLRRVLRIWPLYFTVVLIGLVLIPLVKRSMDLPATENLSVWSFAFFYNNLSMAHGLNSDSTVLSVLWSIGVEEQFYLVWPVLLALLPVRWYPAVFGAVVACSIVFKITAPSEIMRLWHTFSCMGDLATGALGACIATSTRGRQWIAGWPLAAVMVLHVCWLLLYIPNPFFAPPWSAVSEPVLFAAVSTAIILYQGFGAPSFLRLREAPVLVLMGRISYGLYCLHMVAILIVLQVLPRFGVTGFWSVVLIFPLVGLLGSLGLASLSYRFLESPFLRLKDRFAFIRRG